MKKNKNTKNILDRFTVYNIITQHCNNNQLIYKRYAHKTMCTIAKLSKMHKQNKFSCDLYKS